MSFTVDLYSFSKRENSTKQPGTAAASFQCILKDSSGLVSPVIALDLGRTFSPASYNYAYIPTFGRYYFIAEWTYNNALWEARMICDVLATYKAQIGASSLYVLRASSAYDGSVVDNLYPMKAGVSHSVTPFSMPWTTILNAGNINGGCFVIGVVSDNPTHGSIKYYAASTAQLTGLCSALISNFVVETNGFDVNDASLALQKSLIDPFDFIKSCIWIPGPAATVAGSGISQNISVFGFNTNSSGYIFGIGAKGVYTGNVTISGIGRHPQAGSRGVYLNISPYTEAELFCPPFGLIPIDTRILAQNPAINLNWRIDCMTGAGILNVEIGGTVVNRVEAQVGVPIQLSQIRQDIIGGITSAVNGAMSALSGNIIGAAAGIGSAVQAMAPKANTIGGAGGWADLDGTPGLVQHFYPVTNDDPDHAGRPLMAVRQISSLSGYIICQDGDVSISGTQTEAETIRSYLEGGFYYE